MITLKTFTKLTTAPASTGVCPFCWGELHPNSSGDFYECNRHTVMHHELSTLMLVVVSNKTRQHSAAIPCSDLCLTGKMQGIVIAGPHSGLNWSRGT